MKWNYLNFEEKSITIPREEMKIKNQNLSDFKIPFSSLFVKRVNLATVYTSL